MKNLSVFEADRATTFKTGKPKALPSIVCYSSAAYPCGTKGTNYKTWKKRWLHCITWCSISWALCGPNAIIISRKIPWRTRPFERFDAEWNLRDALFIAWSNAKQSLMDILKQKRQNLLSSLNHPLNGPSVFKVVLIWIKYLCPYIMPLLQNLNHAANEKRLLMPKAIPCNWDETIPLVGGLKLEVERRHVSRDAYSLEGDPRRKRGMLVIGKGKTKIQRKVGCLQVLSSR